MYKKHLIYVQKASYLWKKFQKNKFVIISIPKHVLNCHLKDSSVIFSDNLLDTKHNYSTMDDVGNEIKQNLGITDFNNYVMQ